MDCRKAAAFRRRVRSRQFAQDVPLSLRLPQSGIARALRTAGLNLAQDQWMNMEKRAHAALEHELDKAEIRARFQHALDQSYRRLRDAARSDWERLFGKDPADACVTVRFAGTESIAVRGSGFLRSRRQVSKPDDKDSVPHFAH